MMLYLPSAFVVGWLGSTGMSCVSVQATISAAPVDISAAVRSVWFFFIMITVFTIYYDKVVTIYYLNFLSSRLRRMVRVTMTMNTTMRARMAPKSMASRSFTGATIMLCVLRFFTNPNLRIMAGNLLTLAENSLSVKKIFRES